MLVLLSLHSGSVTFKQAGRVRSGEACTRAYTGPQNREQAVAFTGMSLLVDQRTSQGQKRVFAIACAVLVLATLALLPAAGRPLLRLPEFATVFGLLVGVLDIVTWLLLAMRAGNEASPSIRAIAAGYLFSGLMALAHVLTFPGALLADRPVIGSQDTVGLLFLAWRLGFAALLLAGVLLDMRPQEHHRGPAVMWRGAALTAAVVAACVLAAVWLPAHLPDVKGGAFGFGPWMTAWSAVVVSAAALLLIWRARRLHRTLYLWLGFALLANALGLCLSETGGARYTVGWYAARAFAVLASSVLLALLLHEVLQLQRTLAGSVREFAERAEELQAEIQRREAAEQRLERSRKLELVGQLASGVAHDFNNHLQIVATRLELLRHRVGGEPGVAKDLEVLDRTLQRARGLTTHLLSVSGRHAQELRRVELTQWLRSCAELLQTLVPTHIRLKVTLPAHACPVLLDPGELESGGTNLVSNARDALGETTGEIEVSLQQRPFGAGTLAELAVRDNGPGMPQEVVRRALDPFFTTKAPGKGYGLGLSQVQTFTERNRGMLAIDSTPGTGTVVRLSVPVVELEDAQDLEDAAGRPDAIHALVGRSVLVVDDNPDVAASTAALLEHLGMSAHKASSADEAWALMEQGPARPRVLLTDIMMNGSATGLGLARQVRRHCPGVTIVLCTGYLHHHPFLEDNLRLKSRNRLYPPHLYKGIVWYGNPKLMCMTRLNELPKDEPVTVEPMRAFPHVRPNFFITPYL